MKQVTNKSLKPEYHLNIIRNHNNGFSVKMKRRIREGDDFEVQTLLNKSFTNLADVMNSVARSMSQSRSNFCREHYDFIGVNEPAKKFLFKFRNLRAPLLFAEVHDAYSDLDDEHKMYVLSRIGDWVNSEMEKITSYEIT